MKVSEVTNINIADYLKLEFAALTEAQKAELTTLIDIAKSIIRSYTGLDDTALDIHNEFIIVVYVLCQDMHDNRTLYVEKDNLNKVVDSILGMHCTNLLPTPDEVVI